MRYSAVRHDPSGNWPFCQPLDQPIAIAVRILTGGEHCVVVRIHSTENNLRLEEIYASFGSLISINVLVIFVKGF